MSSDLYVGLSGLLAAQRALEITGHNIANANTPGFHRQAPIIVTELPNASPVGPMGRGVKIAAIQRLRDEYLESRILEHTSKLGLLQIKNRFYKELELVFNEFSGTGLDNVISTFFNGLQELSLHPESISLRSQVAENAKTLTDSFQQLHGELNKMLAFAREEIKSNVDSVNNITSELAELNQLIISSQTQEGKPNDLMDRQDALLDDLSNITGVSAVRQENGTINVLLSGRLLVSADSAYKLTTNTNSDGNVEVFFEGDTTPTKISNGELKGLLDVQNNIIPDYLNYLNNLASGIIKEINKTHSEGVGLSGGFTSVVSANAVSDSTAPLNTANLGLPFVPVNGVLYVTVTDSITGAVTKTKLTINPATDSLNDLAAMIDAVPNLDATVNNGKLSITAASGYKFHFTKAVDPNPGSIGSSTINLSGDYTGGNNDTYTFTALGTGTIGSTIGLQIEVKNSNGSTVSILDVGDTYTPGSIISIDNGVSVSFSGDSITTGNNLSFDVINDSDTSDILTSLGVNVFFNGKDASDISLSQNIVDNPSIIAAATTSSPGDNTNALRLAGLQFANTTIGNVNTTFSDYLHSFEAILGSESKRTTRENDSSVATLNNLENRRSETSGVSIDEELLNLVRFQRAYQASARFISVISDLTNTIFNI